MTTKKVEKLGKLKSQTEKKAMLREYLVEPSCKSCRINLHDGFRQVNARPSWFQIHSSC